MKLVRGPADSLWAIAAPLRLRLRLAGDGGGGLHSIRTCLPPPAPQRFHHHLHNNFQSINDCLPRPSMLNLVHASSGFHRPWSMSRGLAAPPQDPSRFCQHQRLGHLQQHGIPLLREPQTQKHIITSACSASSQWLNGDMEVVVEPQFVGIGDLDTVLFQPQSD